MKTTFLASLATLALLIPGLRAQNLPIGSDAFLAAPAINAYYGLSGSQDLTGFSAEAGEPIHHPSGEPSGQHSAWWKWTAPASGFCTVDTRRSASLTNGMQSTVLAVYQGSAVNDLTLIGANARHSSESMTADATLSSVIFYAEAGSTYHIAADAIAPGFVTPQTRNIRLQLRLIELKKAVRTGIWFINEGSGILDMGSLTVTTTATGRFSGRLTTLTKSWPITGIFGADGYATVSILRPGKGATPPQPPITVVIDIAGDGEFVLKMDNLVSINQLFEKQVFTSLSPNTMAGRYTAAIAPGALTASGYGSLALTVSPAGVVKAAGTAPDGTRITFSTALHTYINPTLKLMPYFVPMYAKKGGLLQFNFITENGDDDILGTDGGYLVRPPATNPAATFYPNGFTAIVGVTGRAYKPAPAGRALGFLNATNGAGQMTVANIGLELPGGTFAENLTLTEKNKFIFASAARKPVLKLNVKTGIVTGSFRDDAGKKRSIRSVLVHYQGGVSIVGLATGSTLTLPMVVGP